MIAKEFKCSMLEYIFLIVNIIDGEKQSQPQSLKEDVINVHFNKLKLIVLF